MSRWEPDARGRLETAAIELFGEVGFEQTTVLQIAQRAGLTERTFFRHFADKREVLFARSAELCDLLVNTVTHAPPGTPPLDVVAAAIEVPGALFEDQCAWSRERHRIIAANPELQERDLVKLATFSAAIADALRARGVSETAAILTAEAAIAVFRVAFDRWASDELAPPWTDLVREAFEELKAVTAPR